jgi:putative ABC transport system ATP-binding protein
MSATVRCHDVSHAYPRRGQSPVVAVNHVDLEIEPGQFVAVQGPSGSGKTTLLGIIAGIEAADSGSVEILGHELADLTVAERARLRRLRMGIVFQSFGLIPSLRVGDNVALPLALDGASRADRERRARQALESVGLDNAYHARIDELSGGQRQRVGVARAIVGEPQLVLADEPTGSLDDETAASILGLLRARTRDLGASLLLVTHDPDSAELADERYHMLDGTLTRLTNAAAAQ